MPLVQARLSGTGSGAAYRYEELSEFTGGLNLRADQFNLEDNESPALLNVTVDPRGGVERRDSIDALNGTALPNSIIALGSHSETPVGGGADQILAACLNSGGSAVELHYSTGGDFADMELSSATATLTGTTIPFFVTFNDFTYIGNGALFSTSYSTVKWSGANDITRLTPDIDGSDGHFPTARYATTWGERIWVAYTVESTTTYANRIRFSKINDAENWTATDFIDIDIGEHGDRITGIVADGDRLLIFKQNAVYALYGFDTDSFQVQNITRVVGAVDGCLPIPTPYGVFFWYAQEGLYLLTRDSLDYVFQRLYPTIVPLGALTFTTQPSIMWFDERLWLSVDYQSGEGAAGGVQTNRRNVFVWDPSLGQAGAWTRYDINARSLFSYSPPGGTHLALGVTSDWSGTAAFTRVSKFEQSADTDDYTGSGASEIFSHYQTRWLSGNRPTFPKRWGKTRTVMLAENTVTVDYTVYKDYSLASGTIVDSNTIVGEGSTSVWGSSPSDAGAATWTWDGSDTSAGTTPGDGVWSSQGLSKVYKFFRWPTAGTARAISVRFSVNPTTGARGKWGMTSLVGMYRTRRIR